jgi:hypothetical protein
MAIDPIALRNKILWYLNQANHNNNQITSDMWLAVAKALSDMFGDGAGDHRNLSHRSDPDQHPASAISADTSTFNHNLSNLDINVQHALETLDDLVLGVDDHKVKADAPDGSPDYLQGKIKDGAHIAWTIDTTGGIRKLRGDVTWPTIPSGPTASLEIPLPDGVGDPGDTSSNEYAAKRHVHPALTPAAAASTLYTAQKLDPNDHGQVVSVFISYTSCTPSLWAGWTEISPGVMQKNTTGWLSSAQFDGTMVIPPAGLISDLVGKTVLAYAGPGESTYDQALSGPYVVEDAGGSWVWTLDIPTSTYYWLYVPTYARMRRAPGYDAAAGFVQNMTFQTQTGNVYGTGFFTLTTPQPITLDVTPLAWTFTPGPTYPWVLTKELLTNSQLVSEGVSNATLSISKSIGGLGNAAFDGFPTLVGTPGLSSLPAGPWKFDFEGVWLDADIGGSTAISVEAYRVSGTSGTLFTTPGTIIHNTVAAPLSIIYNAPSFAWSPTDQLVFIAHVQNTVDTGSSLVTANFIYNSASRLTRVTVPFDMAGGTSGDHRFLSHRNDPSQHLATAVDTDTGSFTNNLSGADTTVQHALNTLDALTFSSSLPAPYYSIGGKASIGNPSGAVELFNVGTTGQFTVTSAGVVAAPNITATPGVAKTPISDGSATLNSWVTNAPAGSIVTSTTNVTIGSTAPSGIGQTLVTTSTTNATWQSIVLASSVSGTTNYVSKFVSASAIGNSQIFDDGTHVSIGNTSTTALLNVGTAGQFTVTSAGVVGAANITATPSATRIPISDVSGTLNSWVTSAPASSFVTSTTNVTISSTAPSGASQALVTTSTTNATWQVVATLSSSTPSALVYGGAGNAGSGTSASKFDHVHPLPQITQSQIITALGSIVSPGTYTKVTVDAAGLVTVGGSISLIDVTTALGYTPVSTTSGTTNFLPKYYAVTSLTPSQVSDDGVTITMGTVANATLRVNGGTASMYIGQLSDNTGYSGLAVSSGISTSNFCFAADVTAGTVVNANAGKTVFFNVGNVNYASVTNTGIAASNISATPGAGTIPKADGSATLNSWVTGRVISAGAQQFTSGLIVNPDSTWHDVVSTSITYVTGETIILDASIQFSTVYSNSSVGVSIWISANGGAYVFYGLSNLCVCSTLIGGGYYATGYAHAILTGAAPGTMSIVARALSYNNSVTVPAGSNYAELRIQIVK